MFEAEGPSNQENLEESCGQGHVRPGILSLKPSNATGCRRYKPAKITVVVANAAVCDVNENVFICLFVVCACANYCHVVSMQGVPWSFNALKYR